MRDEGDRTNRLSDPSVPIDVFQMPMALGANCDGVDLGAATLDDAMRRLLASRGYQQIASRLRPSVEIPVAPLDPATEGRGDTPNAWYVNEIGDACGRLAEAVADSIAAERFALMLGGDHAASIGSLAGAGVAGRLGVIWIDAHADINTPETSPSGNVHGMPLAVALGQGPERLTAIGARSGLRIDDLVYIGLRDLDPAERDLLRSGPALVFTADAIEERGIDEAILTAIDRLLRNGVDAVHLSIDIDSLDPSIVPGTGTRFPGGLTYRELIRAIGQLRRSNLPIASADVVELNPLLDPTGGSTIVAAALATALLGRTAL